MIYNRRVIGKKEKKYSMKAMNVIYDEQMNRYYRVDKQTGRMTSAHKNGALLKQFHHEYTGQNFHIRKQREPDLSPSSITHPPFRVKYPSSNTNTLHKAKSTSKLKRTPVSIHQNKKTYFNSALATTGSHFRKTDFSNRMNQYAVLKENKVNQNHSPLKEKEGSSPFRKLLNSYDNEINYGFQAPKQKQNRKTYRNIKNITLPKNCSLKTQLSKQKQIFYQCTQFIVMKDHPELVPKENQRQLKELKERKINMRILEKLALEQNDRCTKNIYH